MQNVIKQSLAIININIRSIKDRLGLSLSTIFSIALVVGVLLSFLAMSNGFKQTLQGSGSEDIAIILRSGSMAEINSTITLEQARLLELSPGIAQHESGPFISKELYVVVDGIQRRTNTEANLPLRGIDNLGPLLRKDVTIMQGRMFTPGTNEIVVGQGLLNNFAGFDLNQNMKLGNTNWKVVGVFAAPGTIFDSELWADVTVVQSFFQRNLFQTLRAKLESKEDIQQLQEYTNNDPRLNVDVKTEKDFYLEQSSASSDIIFYLGWPLSILMAIGALAGAINTMYNSVVARTNEIVTLRIIGFNGLSTFIGTMVESITLSVLGAVIGIIGSYFLFDGLTTSTLSGNFTQVVFSFSMTFELMLQAFILALTIGIIGGIMPARRAAKIPLIQLSAG